MHGVLLTLPMVAMAAPLAKKVGISTGIPLARFRGVPCPSDRPGRVFCTGGSWLDRVGREPGMVQGWEGTGFSNGNLPGFLESSESSLARTVLTDGSGSARVAVSG